MRNSKPVSARVALLPGALLCAGRLHATECKIAGLDADSVAMHSSLDLDAIAARGLSVAKRAARLRTSAIAQDHANFHYTPAAQEIFATDGGIFDQIMEKEALAARGPQTLPASE
jgi:ABC-type sulfate transport system substrate-binding protein